MKTTTLLTLALTSALAASASADLLTITKATWNGETHARYNAISSTGNVSGTSNDPSGTKGAFAGIFGNNAVRSYFTANWHTGLAYGVTEISGSAETTASLELDPNTPAVLDAYASVETEYCFDVAGRFSANFHTDGGSSRLGRLDALGNINWIAAFSGNNQNLLTSFTTGTYVWQSDYQLSSVASPNGRLYDHALTDFSLATAAAPVPEPASMAVLGLGAAALLRRRRKA